MDLDRAIEAAAAAFDGSGILQAGLRKAIPAFLRVSADDYEADGRDSLAVHLRIVAEELAGEK